MSETVLGKDIKRGDLIKDMGLVFDVDVETDPTGFWRGEPRLTFIEYHDPWMGICSSSLDPDKEYVKMTDDERAKFAVKAREQLVQHVKDIQEQIVELDQLLEKLK